MSRQQTESPVDAMLRHRNAVVLSGAVLVVCILLLSKLTKEDSTMSDHLHEAKSHMRLGNYQDAIACYRQAVLAGEDAVTAALGEAECHYSLHTLAGDRAAIAICDRLVTVSPKAHTIRGLVMERQGLLVEAKGEYLNGSVGGDIVAMAKYRKLNGRKK